MNKFLDLTNPITLPMDMLTFYCPHCRKDMNISSLTTDFRQGTTLCKLCGIVIEDRIIDFTEEIRKFSSEGGSDKNLSRLNGGFRNDNMADGGLSLAVSGSSSIVAKMAQRLGVTSEEQSKVKAYKLIREWGGLLGVQTKFQDQAKEGFDKMVAQMGNLKGHSVECLTAAVLSIVCKGCETPLSAKKVSETCNLDIQSLKRGYKHAKGFVKVDALEAEEFKYCRELCRALGVRSLAALSVTKKIKELGLLDGKNPRTCAAVAVSLAMDLQPGSSMWKDMVGKANIGGPTIKKGWDIVKSHPNVIPSCIEHHLPMEKASN